MYNLSLLLIYFIHSSLHLLIAYSCLGLPSFRLPTSNHWFVLCIYESVSVLLHSFVLLFRFHM